MNNRILGLLVGVLLAAAPALAQTVRADRVTLNAGPCVITSGSAAPNGSRVGNVCDTFIQTTSGAIWTKTSGTGTSSGWIATLAGTGTPGTLAVWTSAGAIGDSIIAQAGGVATITGSATITGTGTMNAASITNNATIGGTATMSAATITNNASVGGTATIGTEHVTGNSTIDAALAVGGTSTLTGNTTLGGWIGTAGYASQVSGWRITNTGAADVRYLFTNELRANIFTADAESVLAGSMRVTKSYSTVAQPFTCPTSGTATLWVKDAATYGDAPVFENTGLDWVVIHTLTRSAFGPFTIADCVGTVSNWADGTGANAGQQSWTFTRGAGANGGTMTNAVAVPVDQLVQDMGATGNGYIEMTAVDGANGVNAPYLQVNTWATSPVAANLARQCRLGNLVGIFGNGPEYGLACGATVGQGGFLRLSNLSFEIRNVPVDLYDGATQVVRLDPAGPSLALGSPLPTSYGVNSGLWAGKDSDGIYKLRVGDPTGNRLTWNGAQLQIIGEGSGITNINGGNIQAGTISASAINITPNGAALNSDPNALSTSAWQETGNPGYQATSTRVTDGVAGYFSMRSQVGHSSAIAEVKPTPVDGGHKTYRLHAWVRAGGGSTGSFLFGVLAYNAGGGGLGGAFIASIPGPIATTWSDVSGILPLPSNTATVEPLLYLNWDNVTLTRPGWMEAQDIRLEEVLPSTLIKDGAITTAKIQAGAITAGTLFVKPTGAAINFDPGVSDQSAWTDVGGAGYPALITAVSDGMTGATSLRSQSGQMAVMNSRSYFAIDPNKTYRVHAWVRQSTPANGSAFTFALDVLNAGGVYLGAAFPINQTCNCGAWTELIATFTKAALPVGTTQITPRIYLNNGGGSTGWMEAQDIRIEEVLPSTLIKDGAITTTKIAAHTITGDNIKAGSITANEINVAAGYGANLIANSTFEGATPALGLAGWTQDLLYPDGAMVNSCCGIHGPGTLYLAPGAGQWTVADYLAVPVSYGQTYRVAMDVYAGQATPAGLYVRMLQSNTNSAPRYVRGGGTIPPGDVGADTVSDICANCGLAVGWNHIELVYTPPSPTTWVTMSLFDYTCPQGAAAVCQSLHFDGVEMEQQIGAGSIKAGSITGDRIAARTIISGNIATGTLGANEIAARSLTADRLVANTITSNEIGVRAIVAGNIATGTLTANEIAANTITANKLSVSTLSAITANLGTVTAGSLSAVTITGSTITGTTVTAGCATMDSNGITLSPGGGACNSYKFAGSGVGLWSDGGAWTYLYGQNLQVTGTGSGGYVNFTSDTTIHGANQVLIDSNNNQVHFYNSGYIQLSVSSLSGTAAGSHLCLTTDNYLIRCT